MNAPIIVLVHGWGLSPAIWDRLAARLAGYDLRRASLGYFGPAHFPDLPPPDDPTPVIGVGHSLGFADLLTRPHPWTGLVAVNGFTRFTKAGDFPYGVPPRLLAAMRRRLPREPEATLRDFLTLNGLPQLESGPLDIQAAASGLDFLAELDARDNPLLERLPVRALAATDDALIGPELTRACFGGRPMARIIMRESGGHGMPWSAPEFMAQAIDNFITGITTRTS